MTEFLLAAAAAFLVLVVAGLLVSRRRLSDTKQLQLRVNRISAGYNRGSVGDASAEAVGPSSITRAIAGLAAVEWLQDLIERADTPRSVQWYLIATSGYGAATAVILLFLTGSALLAGVGGIVIGGIPIVLLLQQAAKRRLMFEDQLPEVLDFMSRALQAGHSINMAFKMVGDELPAPASDEFRRVFDEINFGYSFQVSLRRLSARIQSPDLSFLVIGLLIQRETGGNLADLLKKLAELGRDRQKLSGRVKVLAAEGKLSGILLGALPFLIGGAMTAINPSYMSVLWTTEAGQRLVGIGLGMMAVGFVWMSRIVQIKV